ncbi:MAG: DUF4249 domain-containing protein [Bacteroidota bacterium]
MPRNYTLPFLLAYLSFLLPSCEEPIELDLDEKARLVVISNFSDKNELQVVVSKTKSVLSADSVDYVTDASVMVFADNELIELLELVPANPIKNTPPHYRTNNLTPEIGKAYDITVSVPGFSLVTASNSIPVAVPIQSVEFSNTVSDGENNQEVIQFNVSVTIDDPAGFENFYHLVFYPELYRLSQSPEADTIFQIASTLETVSDNVGFPVLKHFDNHSFLFNDQTFEGKSKTLSFSGQYSYEKGQLFPGDFFLELRSVSEDYFYYHWTLTKQVNDGRQPVPGGVVVKGNIENGEGIFAGFSSFNRSFNIYN